MMPKSKKFRGGKNVTATPKVPVPAPWSDISSPNRGMELKAILKKLSPLDALAFIKEEFSNSIEADVVDLIMHESNYDANKTVDNLLLLSNSEEVNVTGPSIDEFDKNEWKIPGTSTIKYAANVPKLNELDSHLDVPSTKDGFWDLQIPTQTNTDITIRKCSDKIADYGRRGYCVLILLRGLPGSGKTYLANNIVGSGVRLSTDDFFLIGGNGYQYNRSKITDAHIWNQSHTEQYIKQNRSPIIIDNTNIHVWEMLPYVKFAIAAGYAIDIMEPGTLWARCPRELAKKNSHGVPKAKIKEMMNNFENITVEGMLRGLKEVNYRPCIFDKCLPTVNEELVESQQNILFWEEKIQCAFSQGKQLVIFVRGVPGSGKTFLAHKIVKDGICMDSDINLFNFAVKSRTNPIIIDDCNLTLADMIPIARIAINNNYIIEIIVPKTPWKHSAKELSSRSSLKLNIAQLEKMLGDFEEVSVNRLLANSLSAEDTVFEDSDDEFVFSECIWDEDDKEVVTCSTASPRKQTRQRLASASTTLVRDLENDQLSVTERILPISITASPIKNEYLNDTKLMIHSSAEVSDSSDVKPISPIMKPIPRKIKLIPFVKPQLISWSGVPSSLYQRPNKMAALFTNPLEFNNVAQLPTRNSTPDDDELLEITPGLELIQFTHKNTNITIPFSFNDNEDIVDNETADFTGQYSGGIRETVDKSTEQNHEFVINDLNKDDYIPQLELLEDEVNTSDEELYHIPTTNSASGVHPIKSRSGTEEQMNLTLPPQFIHSLMERFANSDETYHPAGKEPITISIPEDLCFQMWWILQEQIQNQQSALVRGVKNEALQLGASSSVDSLVPSPTPALKEFMNLEFACNSSVTELELLHQRLQEEETIAAKVGKSMLYKLFPQSDKDILDDIFASNNYSFHDTAETVWSNISTRKTDEPTNVYSPEYIYHMEKNLLSKACKESMKSFSTQNTTVSTNTDDLRTEARLHSWLVEDYSEQCKQASNSGMKRTALFCAEMLCKHERSKKTANSKAYKYIFDKHNMNRDKDILDLHELLVGEALECLNDFLTERSEYLQTLPQSSTLTLTVITGSGIHSTGGQPKIKPAVHNFLHSEGYRYTEINSGLLEIVLQRK